MSYVIRANCPVHHPRFFVFVLVTVVSALVNNNNNNNGGSLIFGSSTFRALFTLVSPKTSTRLHWQIRLHSGYGIVYLNT